MAQISIDLTEVNSLKVAIAEIQNQLPFVMSKTINNVAFKAKEAAKTEMQSVFDRPTSFALNSLYVKKSTKTDLNAIVDFKQPDRISDKEHYLAAQSTGKRRGYKQFEAALYNRGILPRGYYAVPASGADIDQYGNMSRGQIIQILSYFDTFGASGFKTNMGDKGREKLAKSTKRKYGTAYFFVKPGAKNNLHPGIYKRIYSNFGTAIKPVMVFVRGLQYQKLLDLKKIANKTYQQHFKTEFDAAFDYAMKTAIR